MVRLAIAIMSVELFTVSVFASAIASCDERKQRPFEFEEHEERE
jgi:hypothetical protein